MSEDAFEREYMKGEGEILYRHKVSAPRWAFALTVGLPFVLTALASIALLIGAAPIGAALAPVLGGALYTALISGVLLVFAVARVAVSEGELHIALGPRGPRIPIDDIESFEIGASGINSYGLGWQKLLDGTSIYKMLGDNERAVRIVRKSDPRPLVLVCRDPDGLVAAIREAQARANRPKVRVEVEPAEGAEHELEPASEQRRERNG